ncbi:CHAT domain-containing protein [Actinoplanes aureus]|uniref:CHAT domain-containing protein n=1 Tax=Actinoplanes aureus TaxID=2792083 RepID=A0A931FZ24_9ACTN|nr:CHAT domain-containing protein [Actinoplanes aureus]MBG0564270.1 CHAT domain-containing protein [Actinoplanes aureus]
MTVPLRPGWMTLGSLNTEDLHGRPGPARAAALRAAADDPRHRMLHLTDACYGALSAGEAKHALRLLDELEKVAGGPDRHLSALRAWALQLDGNWYPGGIGAETTMDPAGAFVTPAPGIPETELIEHLVADGPPSLATVRAVTETLLRSGNETAARQMAVQGVRALENLARLANRLGAVALGHWCDIAGADLMHRIGLDAEARHLLIQARTAVTLLNLPGLVGVTYLVEGDWSATPGSHPESLGFDLAPQPGPSPALARRDPYRAAECYTAAASWAAGLPLPRLHAALELRQATLAWFAGDRPRRRRHLLAARDAWTTAGDTAGVQLAAVHLLIADLDEGLFADHVATLSQAGQPPEHGPVAGVLAWSASVGSRAWCTGLGRVLQRAAEHWQARGSVARARLGYLAALPLLGADPALPTRPVVTALAAVESRHGLAAPALTRLERLLHCPGPAAGPPEVACAQQLETILAMVDAHRGRIGSAEAERAARGLLRLRDLLREMLPRLGGPGGPRAAIEAIAVIDVLVPLARCGHASDRGLPERAEQWYRVALEAAERPGAAPDLRPLVLVAGGRYAEARTALTELDRDRALPGEVLAPLAVRAGDLAPAALAFARSGGAQRAGRGWHDALTAAEIALAHDDVKAGLAHARTGAAFVEELAATLPRDADRAAVCDQPGVAALYLLAAKAQAALARTEHHRADAADLRRHCFETAGRAYALTVPARPAGPDDTEPWQQWRRSTAEWTEHAHRLHAAIDTPAIRDTAPLVAAADAADAALTRAEFEVERSHPGALLRRAAPPAPFDVRRMQSRLARDTVVLAYLTAGAELMSWVVTSDDVHVHHRHVAAGHLAALARGCHARCASGHGQATEATELAALLLHDAASVLRDHRRVVVVPSGPLRVVPVHALPFAGRPLGLERVVSYAPNTALLTAEDTTLDESLRPARPLVVAGPLPGAGVEARTAAAILGCPSGEVLDTTGDRLRGHDVLLLAAPLPEGGLPADADLVVLSRCAFGRTTMTLGDDVAAVTRDLIRAGVRRVVLPLWPVDDIVAPVVIARFLRGVTEGVPPAHALAEAQRCVARASADQLRAEYTAMGGTPEHELPLGGDAERHWAPFVLIGP